MFVTKVSTYIARIYEKEGYNIKIKKDGKKVKMDSHGHLGSYSTSNRAKGTMTVQQWKNQYFNYYYPKYDCDVLYGDGSIAVGQTTLKTVRDSY